MLAKWDKGTVPSSHSRAARGRRPAPAARSAKGSTKRDTESSNRRAPRPGERLVPLPGQEALPAVQDFELSGLSNSFGQVLCRKSDFPSLEARREARKVQKTCTFFRAGRHEARKVRFLAIPNRPCPPEIGDAPFGRYPNQGGAPPYEMTFTPKSRRCACTNRTLSNPGSVSFSFCELFRLETPFPHPLANRMSPSDRVH